MVKDGVQTHKDFFIESYKFSRYDLSFIVCVTHLHAICVPQPLVKFNLNFCAVTGTRIHGNILLLATHTYQNKAILWWLQLMCAALWMPKPRLLCWWLGWGLDKKVSGGVCMSDPLDSLASPWAQPWILTQRLAFFSVTQHWANKGRHSSDIEKYSRRISRDESDPFCLSSAWYAGGNTNKVKKEGEKWWKDLGWNFSLETGTSIWNFKDAKFCNQSIFFRKRCISVARVLR